MLSLTANHVLMDTTYIGRWEASVRGKGNRTLNKKRTVSLFVPACIITQVMLRNWENTDRMTVCHGFCTIIISF